MRTFFLQLFVSFWLATIVIFIGATIFFPGDAPQSPAESQAIFRSSAAHSLNLTLRDYRSQGCSAASLSDPLWLVADAQGLPLCGRILTHAEGDVLQRAVRQDALAGARSGLQWIHALPITLIAGLGHAFLGHVNFNVLAALLLGSIPGVLIASRITLRLPPRMTRTLIAVMLGTVSERMLFG